LCRRKGRIQPNLPLCEAKQRIEIPKKLSITISFGPLATLQPNDPAQRANLEIKK
jgi:hypothetical protein